MKILITGALGYIGCEILLKFSQRPDVTVYAVDNDIDALKNRSAVFSRFPNINVINADITEPLCLPNTDIIVHLAAAVGYTTCNNKADLTYKTNVLGTQNIASLGVPTILFSTGSVYGEIGSVCNESVPPNPKTVYATTKYQAEQCVQQIPHVIFRPATAFGLGFKIRHDLLIHDLVQQALTTKHIDLYQPNALRSFYSIQKLAELVEFTCDNFDLFKGNTYNVGCQNGNVIKKSLVELLAKHIDFDYQIVPGSDADTRDYNVSYDKLASIWPALNEDFDQKVTDIIDYYKQWL